MFTLKVKLNGDDYIGDKFAFAIGFPSGKQISMMKDNVVDALARIAAGVASKTWKERFQSSEYPKSPEGSLVARTWESIYRNAPIETATFIRGQGRTIIGSNVLYEKVQVYGSTPYKSSVPMPIETRGGTIFRTSSKGVRAKGPFHIKAAQELVSKRAAFAFEYVFEHFMDTGKILTVDQIVEAIGVGV